MNRKLVATLTLSGAAFLGLLSHEGFSPTAYKDPTWGWKVPTIGYGTTTDVQPGDTITEPEARVRARQDVAKFEGALRKCVKVPLHQVEYDVYVDLSYNIGSSAFCNSTMVRRLNAGNYKGACDAILMWKMSNGVDCSTPSNRVCSGLWKRRLAAHSQCMSVQ